MWKYHDREKPHSTDLDLPGVLTLAIALHGVLALVSRPRARRLADAGGASLLAIAALVAIAYFVIHERRAANPIMPPNLLLQPRRSARRCSGSLLLGVGFLSLDTYVPLYVQGGRGGDANGGRGRRHAGHAHLGDQRRLRGAAGRALGVPQHRAARLVPDRRRLQRAAACCAATRRRTGSSPPSWRSPGLGFGPASMSYLLAAQDAVHMAAARHRDQQHAVLPHDRRRGRHRPASARCSTC